MAKSEPRNRPRQLQFASKRPGLNDRTSPPRGTPGDSDTPSGSWPSPPAWKSSRPCSRRIGKPGAGRGTSPRRIARPSSTGSTAGQVGLGGRKVRVCEPRVRSANPKQEFALPLWWWPRTH